MKPITILVLAGLVSAMPTMCSARTWHVPGDAATIQGGLDKAAPTGDVVLVHPDTYSGPDNMDLDFKGKDIVLRSDGGPEVTIIDCLWAGRGFYFHGGETPAAAIEGFTIKNGDVTYEGGFGGGIYCSFGSPTITNCTFLTNKAERGGGLYCTGESAPTFDSCAFDANAALMEGGGIYCDSWNLNLTACEITGNHAVDGGAMYCKDNSPDLTDCLIGFNSAENGGAGIYCSGSSPGILRCGFVWNRTRSTGRGGGMYCTDSSSPSLSDCEFDGNWGQLGGGAVYCVSAAPSIVDCTFHDNWAFSAGGAVYSESVTSETLEITDSDFTENYTETEGGGLCLRGSLHNVVGCTFSGNSASQGGGIYNQASEGTLTDCMLSENDASVCGGGMAAKALWVISPSAALTRCEFTGNTAPIGGGFYCEDDTLSALTDCNFSTNTADNGGGLYCLDGSVPRMDGCWFIDNDATVHGGGMYCRNSSGPLRDLTRCRFYDNSAGSKGGGMYACHSRVTLEDCVFVRNEACVGAGNNYESTPAALTGCHYYDNLTATGFGGAVACRDMSGAPMTLTYCTLSGNSALVAGGIYCVELGASLTNCTISNNTSILGAGVVTCDSSSVLTLDRTIIAFNRNRGSVGCFTGSSIDCSDCDIYGNVGGDWVNCIVGQEGTEGNFSADPTFCDYENHICTLREDSPCLPDNHPEGIQIGAWGLGCPVYKAPAISDWGLVALVMLLLGVGVVTELMSPRLQDAH